jgi:hypothetical protein
VAWKAQPGRPCPRLALFWVGIIILVFPWWCRSFQGTRSYICPEGNWYFRVDALGILLILPQWIRWAANETRESITGLRGIVRRWISPSALFTLTLVAGNLTFLSQSNHFASLLWNVIGLLLWFFGPLKRSWKIAAGVFFALRLALLLTALFGDFNRYDRIAMQYGHHPAFPQNLAYIPQWTSGFHRKIQQNPLWYPGFAPTVPYPKPNKNIPLRQFQFCEQVTDIVRFRTGLLGILCLGMILTGMGVALVRIARRHGTPEQRLWRMAFAAFLFIPMAGSMIGTLTNTWLIPDMSFPFLGVGFTLTTTAWLALGLLLREARIPLGC